MRIKLFLLLISLSVSIIGAKNIISSNVCYIDSLQYYQSYKKEFPIHKCNSIVSKHDSTLVPLTDTTYVFKTDTLENNWLHYIIVGEVKNNIIICEQDYHKEIYYIINKISNNKYKVVGSPQFYKKFILCIEGSYTDSPNRIQVWEYDSTKIDLYCDIKIHELLHDFFAPSHGYIGKNCLFLRDMDRKYICIPLKCRKVYKGN